MLNAWKCRAISQYISSIIKQDKNHKSEFPLFYTTIQNDLLPLNSVVNIDHLDGKYNENFK